MPSLNKIILCGHAGKDAEEKGKAVKFSLATSYGIKKDNDWENKTSWHNIVCFGSIFEKALKVKKGDAVFVEGRVDYNEYEGKTYTSILADKISILAPSGKKAQGSYNNNQTRNNQDDIPF